MTYAELTGTVVSDFCEISNLTNLRIKRFKNPSNLTGIDLIVTKNRPKCLQDIILIETGLSDFRKMSITVIKMYYNKQKPSIVYPKIKNFCNDSFMEDVRILLSKLCN